MDTIWLMQTALLIGLPMAVFGVVIGLLVSRSSRNNEWFAVVAAVWLTSVFSIVLILLTMLVVDGTV